MGSSTYFSTRHKWIALHSQGTKANSFMSFSLTFCSISTENISTRIYAFLINTCFVVGTVVIYNTFVLETFFMRIASPVRWTSTYCPMRCCFTQSFFPTRFRYYTRIKTLVFYTGPVVSTFIIMITFSSFNFATLNCWVSCKSWRALT